MDANEEKHLREEESRQEPEKEASGLGPEEVRTETSGPETEEVRTETSGLETEEARIETSGMETEEALKAGPEQNKKGLWKGVVFFFLCFTLSFVLGALLCYFYFFGFPKRQENQAIHNGAASSSTLSDSNLENLESINLPRVTEKLRKIQDLLTDSYLYQENGKDAEEMIYKGFLTSLLQEDPYAAYYTKEEIEETRNRQKGIYKGIGAAVSEKEGGPLVEYVYPGSPAEKAGLLAGDIVLKVDGISVESLSLNYIVENLIQGLAGSSLEMVVNRNGEEVTLRITRGELVIPGSEVGDVAEMLKLQSGAEKQNETDPQKSEEQQPDVNRDVLAKLKPGDIGYLSLRGFYMEAVDSFISQYESDIDGKKKALIIDLRGNPGGDVEAATKLLDYFLPDHLQKPKRKDSENKTIQTENRGESASSSSLEVTPNPNRQFEKDKTLLLYTEDKWGKGKDWYAKDGHEVDLPIIILMNQNSASASELFAGTMQDYDRAWVFGTLSYGKGIVQTVRSFPDGSAVEFTTHYYFTPAGRNIHKKGITPDLTVEMPEADQFTYLRDRTKDLQLRKAAESLYINFIHDKNSP
ncbi:S41 family peptidase [Oribacterium sinus]|uniref:Peptidase, S41 family n=1 Tax=Oribacterium sinus F0268 TaxID=585501 RepID=C2KYQ1_9FIRM|nr:S41 family peptidase [Oribacterium sinus]EEJ51106.1 peptidase, S41 family [Oribacterium sinus F0268]